MKHVYKVGRYIGSKMIYTMSLSNRCQNICKMVRVVKVYSSGFQIKNASIIHKQPWLPTNKFQGRMVLPQYVILNSQSQASHLPQFGVSSTWLVSIQLSQFKASWFVLIQFILVQGFKTLVALVFKNINHSSAPI